LFPPIDGGKDLQELDTTRIRSFFHPGNLITFGTGTLIVKVGFIGIGFMGQVAHLDNYIRTPECEVTALCDVRPRLLKSVAAKYRIPRTYTSLDKLLDDPELDAVICCQHPSNTFNLAHKVLSKGKHLLTGNPMSTRLEDAAKLVKLAQENEIVYGVSCLKRYDIGVDAARTELNRIMETGEMGALLRVDAHCFGGDWINEIRPPIDFPDEPPPEHPQTSYPDFVKYDAKPAFMEYLTVYIHNINLIRYLLPQSELRFVHALISNRNQTVSHTTSFGADGVPVCLRGTSSNAHEWQEETAFTFEKGRLTLKTPPPLRMQASAVVEIYRSDGHAGKTHTLHSPRLWSLMLQAAGFTGAAAGIGGFRAPGEDCIEDIALVEEIFKKGKLL